MIWQADFKKNFGLHYIEACKSKDTFVSKPHNAPRYVFGSVEKCRPAKKPKKVPNHNQA